MHIASNGYRGYTNEFFYHILFFLRLKSEQNKQILNFVPNIDNPLFFNSPCRLFKCSIILKKCFKRAVVSKGNVLFEKLCKLHI